MDTIGLGVAAVSGLLQKTKLDPAQINEVIWGAVGTRITPSFRIRSSRWTDVLCVCFLW